MLAHVVSPLSLTARPEAAFDSAPATSLPTLSGLPRYPAPRRCAPAQCHSTVPLPAPRSTSPPRIWTSPSGELCPTQSAGATSGLPSGVPVPSARSFASLHSSITSSSGLSLSSRRSLLRTMSRRSTSLRPICARSFLLKWIVSPSRLKFVMLHQPPMLPCDLFAKTLGQELIHVGFVYRQRPALQEFPHQVRLPVIQETDDVERCGQPVLVALVRVRAFPNRIGHDAQDVSHLLVSRAAHSSHR